MEEFFERRGHGQGLIGDMFRHIRYSEMSAKGEGLTGRKTSLGDMDAENYIVLNDEILCGSPCELEHEAARSAEGERKMEDVGVG